MRPPARRLIGTGAALALGVLTVVPIGLVLLRSAATPAGLTLRHYHEALADATNLEAAVNTIVVSGATVAFATLLAVPLAWLVARTDLPGARRFRVLLLVPFVVPPYLGAIAWINRKTSPQPV